MGRFVKAANEVTIGGFWREHTKGELKTRKNHEILRFLSPCWEKKYMGRVFYAGDAIFDAFVQEWLNTPINLLLALYLVYPRYLFNMGPAYMFSRGVETLRIDEYLTLVLLTQGSPKCENLFMQVCCLAEDVAGGVYHNEKLIPDGRGEKSQDERRVEGGECRHTSLD